MEIIFAGICCWVDAPSRGTGKTVIIRNALGGGWSHGVPIPPHHAFIHLKRDQVDAREWAHDWSGSEDNLLFYLSGDYVSFDPMPSGGSIDLNLVPHVLTSDNIDPICPAAEEIRAGFLEEPSAVKVLALVDIPAEANVRGEANQHDAIYVSMTIPGAPVTITATPFNGGDSVRSLTVTDPNARVFIANVTMSEYLTGVGANDDSHRYLVCEIFKPKAAARTAQSRKESPRGKGSVAGEAAEALSGLAALDHISLSTLRRAANRNMNDFLDTLAAGCSDSQWP